MLSVWFQCPPNQLRIRALSAYAGFIAFFSKELPRNRRMSPAFLYPKEWLLLAESGFPVLLRKFTTVEVVRRSGLELSGDLVGYRPAAKRALLGPFSGEAGFTSSAIPRRRLHRILLSNLSVPCDSSLWSR